MTRRLARAVLPWALAFAAHAQDVTIYRCTDAGGGLAIQNMPCPKGTQQQKKVMPALQTPPPPRAAAEPAPIPAPAAAANPADAAAATAPRPEPAAAPSVPEVDETPRLPPPPLFQCTTRDNDSYLTDDENTATRCVPMQVVGLDGNPRGGAGEACEMVSDRCARVPDGALCDGWKKQLLEAESHWRFATPEHAAARQQEYQRLRRIVDESSCGAPAAPAG